MVLVSVIVPAYRAEATIARAVASVLGQSLAELEVVIASDDGVDYLAVLAAAGLGDARLRQVMTGGIATGEGPARNAAVAVAAGTLIANLDADDAFAPERLAVLAPLALAHGAATDATQVLDETERPVRTPFPEIDPAGPPFEMTPARVLGPRVPFFPVFRRELAGTGWTAVPFAADVLFNLELGCRAQRYMASPRPLYRYIKTTGSITQSADTAAVAETGYAAILGLLDSGALNLTPAVRAAAIDEFSANRALNRLFAVWHRDGRVDSLDGFLALTENGRAAWVPAALADLAAAAAASPLGGD